MADGVLRHGAPPARNLYMLGDGGGGRDALAQNFGEFAADNGRQSLVGFGEQRLLTHAAEKGAEHHFAGGRGACEFAMHKGTGQHGAALALRNQEAEALG